MSDERKTFGTAELEAPISRDDFERAVRYLHLSDIDAHEMLLRLAAQVVALTEASSEATQERVRETLPELIERIRANDARTTGRVWIAAEMQSKYQDEGPPVPCAELMHLCKARCCTLVLALSTEDLDEGVIRWDYGQPYRIRQRASDGYCVHNDPTTHGCTVHKNRPGICRRYDCRNDERIWTDYDKQIPAPEGHLGDGKGTAFDLMERVKLRAMAEAIEHNAVTRAYPEAEPREGPVVTPRAPRPSRP